MYEIAYRKRQNEMFMQLMNMSMQEEYQDTNTRAR